VIRLATSEDVSALAALRLRSAWSLSWCSNGCRGPASYQLGLRRNAFVLQTHRNAGIGRASLGAVDHARDNDFVRVVLSPSPRSVPFYRRAGFVGADELLVLRLRTGAGNAPVPAGQS